MTYKESLLLTGDAWTTLSDEKKVEVLQTIENHMALESQRMSAPVEGKFLHTGPDGVVLGTYDPGSGRIYINTSQFDPESMYGKDSSRLVTACLHEGRHAWQHQAVNGLARCDDPEEVEQWRENLKDGNYISFRENPKGYYEQPVEVDARAFAAGRYKELQLERLRAEIDRPADHSQAKRAFEAQMEQAGRGEDKLAAGNDPRLEQAGQHTQVDMNEGNGARI